MVRLFVHIPKAGGSSVGAAVAAGDIKNTELEFITSLAGTSIHLLRDLPGYHFSAENPRYRFSEVLAISRNPFSWLVSFYFFDLRVWRGFVYPEESGNIPKNYPETSLDEAKRNLYVCEKLGFDGYVRNFFEPIVRDTRYFDHGYTQLDYLKVRGRVHERVKIFTLESGDFWRYMGVQQRFVNKGTHDDYRSYYTESLVKFVTTAFKEDFDYFGYSKEL